MLTHALLNKGCDDKERCLVVDIRILKGTNLQHSSHTGQKLSN